MKNVCPGTLIDQQLVEKFDLSYLIFIWPIFQIIITKTIMIKGALQKESKIMYDETYQLLTEQENSISRRNNIIASCSLQTRIIMKNTSTIIPLNLKSISVKQLATIFKKSHQRNIV